MTQVPAMSAGVGAAPFDVRAFGAALTAAGDISENDWRLAQEVARRNATTRLKSLLDLGLIGENALADRLADFMARPRWRSDDESAPLAEGVPLEFMRSAGLLVFDDAEGPRIIVTDPSDHRTIGAVLALLAPGAAPTSAVGTLKDITQYLDSAGHDQLGDPAGDAAADRAMDVSAEISALKDMASEAPVIRFFNQAVERAMDLAASDIHLERFDRRIGLRFRVDGLLIDQPPPPAALYDPLLCRIKIMSNLDIAERRRAQDGRIRMRLRGRNVDMRVSIVPTMYGQDAAIRLQDRQRLAEVSLEDLGFSPGHIERLFRTAAKSHGILLITGPTGSGKTTSLYAILRRLVNAETKVITVEDPIEYAMDGVNQIQVNPAINLTFSNTLRNILRHDPDVILIGEIRDRETAEMAFQAALTGHMVLSTLHTNNVPGTFVRLVDMGVEPYLVNAAVEGVSAQRLMRRVCPSCHNAPGMRDACKTCGGIGYRGRVAVMEFGTLNPAVKKIMLEGAEEHRLRDALITAGYRPMREDARRLIEAGITDEAEVARALGAHAGAEEGA